MSNKEVNNLLRDQSSQFFQSTIGDVQSRRRNSLPPGPPPEPMTTQYFDPIPVTNTPEPIMAANNLDRLRTPGNTIPPPVQLAIDRQPPYSDPESIRSQYELAYVVRSNNQSLKRLDAQHSLLQSTVENLVRSTSDNLSKLAESQKAMSDANRADYETFKSSSSEQLSLQFNTLQAHLMDQISVSFKTVSNTIANSFRGSVEKLEKNVDEISHANNSFAQANADAISVLSTTVTELQQTISSSSIPSSTTNMSSSQAASTSAKSSSQSPDLSPSNPSVKHGSSGDTLASTGSRASSIASANLILQGKLPKPYDPDDHRIIYKGRIHELDRSQKYPDGAIPGFLTTGGLRLKPVYPTVNEWKAQRRAERERQPPSPNDSSSDSAFDDRSRRQPTNTSRKSKPPPKDDDGSPPSDPDPNISVSTGSSIELLSHTSNAYPVPPIWVHIESDTQTLLLQKLTQGHSTQYDATGLVKTLFKDRDLLIKTVDSKRARIMPITIYKIIKGSMEIFKQVHRRTPHGSKPRYPSLFDAALHHNSDLHAAIHSALSTFLQSTKLDPGARDRLSDQIKLMLPVNNTLFFSLLFIALDHPPNINGIAFQAREELIDQYPNMSDHHGLPTYFEAFLQIIDAHLEFAVYDLSQFTMDRPTHDVDLATIFIMYTVGCKLPKHPGYLFVRPFQLPNADYIRVLYTMLPYNATLVYSVFEEIGIETIVSVSEFHSTYQRMFDRLYKDASALNNSLAGSISMKFPPDDILQRGQYKITKDNAKSGIYYTYNNFFKFFKKLASSHTDRLSETSKIVGKRPASSAPFGSPPPKVDNPYVVPRDVYHNMSPAEQVEQKARYRTYKESLRNTSSSFDPPANNDMNREKFYTNVRPTSSTPSPAVRDNRPTRPAGNPDTHMVQQSKMTTPKEVLEGRAEGSYFSNKFKEKATKFSNDVRNSKLSKSTGKTVEQSQASQLAKAVAALGHSNLALHIRAFEQMSMDDNFEDESTSAHNGDHSDDPQLGATYGPPYADPYEESSMSEYASDSDIEQH